MKVFWNKTQRRCFYGALLGLLYTVSGIATAGTISTILKLPAGSYTLPTDMQVWVRAIAIDGNPGDFVQSLQTFSAATDGPNSQKNIAFALNNTLNYVLQYECTGSTFPLPCEQFVSRLYANSGAGNGTVLRQSEAEVFAGNLNHTGVNLPIQQGIALSGTISTPDSENATADIDLTLLARNVDTPLTDLLSLGYTIEAGTNSVDFEIRVPDDDGESWNLGYSCISVLSPPCEDFVGEGYRKLGAPNNTVEDYVDADDLVGNTDQSGLDFTLLGGFSISGSVIAPMAVSDAAGLRVAVRAQDRNDPTNSFSDTVLIEQSQTSEDYFITVSIDPAADWVVNYSCDSSASPVECAEYLQQGYYNNGTMVETGNQVDPPLSGCESHSDIDLTLLTGPSLSGTLVLSDGEAPAGGLSFTVRAFETEGSAASYVTTVQIAEGETESLFSINVGAGVNNEYRVSYDCNEGLTVACEDVVDEGYYDATSETTVYVLEDANSIANGGVDVSGIVLTVSSEGLSPDELCVPIKTSINTIANICL